jgi:hypothetical protein
VNVHPVSSSVIDGTARTDLGDDHVGFGFLEDHAKVADPQPERRRSRQSLDVVRLRFRFVGLRFNLSQYPLGIRAISPEKLRGRRQDHNRLHCSKYRIMRYPVNRIAIAGQPHGF